MKQICKKIDWWRTLPTLILCLFVLTEAVLNAPLIYNVLKGCVSERWYFDFSGVNQKITDALKSDDFAGKQPLLNYNGLFARFAGRRLLNEVERLNDGYLTAPFENTDVEKQARNLGRYASYLKQQGTPMLYVQAPFKVSQSLDMMPPFFMDYGNDAADQFLRVLGEYDIGTLDLRPGVSGTKEMVERNFYSTDHHWNPNGAFAGFQILMNQLAVYFPGLHTDYTDPELWETHTVPNSFLGSQGRRVGRWFGGVDDLMYYLPTFDTEMACIHSYENKTINGSFREVCLRDYYLNYPGIYNISKYGVYYGGDTDVPTMELMNPKAPNDRRLLVIKDSFALPLLGFLQTEFTRIDVLDPRYYTDSSVAEYIELNKPDLVIVMLNPTMLSADMFTDYDLPAFRANWDKPLHSAEIYTNLSARVDGSQNQNAFFKLPVKLERGRRYTLYIENIELEKGSPDSAMAAIYDPMTNSYVATKWFNPYCEPIRQKDGGYRWSFLCPQSDHPGLLELRLFAGKRDETYGSVLKYDNIRLTEEWMADGSYALYRGENVAVTASDSAWNSMLIPADLCPGRSYLLEARNLALQAGEATEVTVAVDDKNGTLFMTNWQITGIRNQEWMFRLPENIPGEEIHLRVFAGKAGQTEQVALQFGTLTLWELSGGFGEELAYRERLEIVPTRSQWNCIRISPEFQAGKTYTVSVRSLKLNRGYAQSATVALFRDDTGETLDSRELRFGAADQTFTFTVPSERAARNCSVVLYAGTAGATAQVSVTYEHVAVNEWPDTGADTVLLSERFVSIPSAPNAYHFVSWPLTLQPGHRYRLSVAGFSLTNNPTDAIDFVLRSANEGKAVMKESWWNSKTPYPFAWEFTAPENPGCDDLSLLVYAGQSGKTSWVGVNFWNLTLREIE